MNIFDKSGATVPPLFTLMSELSPPMKRGEFVTYVASFWMVGSFYVAITAMYVMDKWDWGWRRFAIACAFPSFLAFILVLFYVPESPRFLAIHGRFMEATTNANIVASKMGFTSLDLRRDGIQLEEVQYFFDSYSRNNLIEGPNNNNNDCSEIKRSIQKLYASSMLKSTLTIQFIWFSLSFGTYGLIIWINTIFSEISPESVYINAIIFAAANLPGNIISAICLDRIGRKAMLALSMLLGAVSLGFFALFSSNLFLSPPGVIISACSFQAFSTSAWNTIDVLSSEIFPTQIRSSGMGSCTAIGRIGAMIAQPINGILIDRPVMLLLLGCITMLIGGVTPLLCHIGDFTGKPLQDDPEAKDIETNERVHIFS